MEDDLLQLNKSLGHKLVSIRVDAVTAGSSKEFSAIAADFGGILIPVTENVKVEIQ